MLEFFLKQNILTVLLSKIHPDFFFVTALDFTVTIILGTLHQ